MKFYSTNNKDHQVSLQEAVVRGLAPDDGLYMPEEIPVLPASFFADLPGMSFQEMAFVVAKNLLGNSLPDEDLKQIISHTLQFDAPLVELGKNIFSLELFHGPTLAFKDFGARFMSQLLGYFARQQQQEIVILVATSGDTGSAVANGFLGMKGIRVVVLYPAGKVSDVQEKQFTTLGQNITALEVQGTFDDCQRLVKMAFQDAELRSNFFLTSANSINIARLVPQSFYYFYGYAQLNDKSKPVVFSVPSGNFGNLTGGLFARRMGLPIEKFVVSTNINDVVPEFLRTRVFKPRPSKQTVSNAMDVGNPSNFSRILDLYRHDYNAIASDLVGYSFTDTETTEVVANVFNEHHYILDPHGAVGFLGVKKFLEANRNYTGIFLETAHPAKFPEVVERAINQKIELPAALGKFLRGTKSTVSLPNNFPELKKALKQL